MLQTNDITLAQEILIQSSDYPMPIALSRGMFPVESISSPFVSHTLVKTNYYLSSDKIDAVRTDSTVSSTVNAKATTIPVCTGIAEVRMKYQSRYDTTVAGNDHSMHKSQVPNALVAINKALSRRVDKMIFGGYDQIELAGLKGLKDYGVDIGVPAIDPANYNAVYMFFAESIGYMTDTLRIPISGITLFIGREAVMMMDSVVLIGGQGQSIWQRLKAFVLAEVTVFVLDSYLLGNECIFLARNYSALYKANTPFFDPGEEDPIDGSNRKVFIRCIEYQLPSIVISDNNACLKQNPLFIEPTDFMSMKRQKAVSVPKVAEVKPAPEAEEVRAKPMNAKDNKTFKPKNA